MEQIDKNDGVEKTLGFAENMTAISKMPVHKGFITSNMRIRFSNGSMFSYSMKTRDYFYEFAKYIKNNNITTTADLVKFVENFINYYFGKPNGIDNRDNYFNNLTLDTKTDEALKKLDYSADYFNTEIEKNIHPIPNKII